MKKYFILAVGIAAAVLTTSCDPQNKPSGNVKLTLDQHELEMSIDETTRLSATVSPSDTKVQLKWASTDANVATVSVSGIVTAVGEGTAKIIVSAEGATGDTCVVTVSDMTIYNNFNIAGWGLFGNGWEMIPGTDTTLTWEDGTKYDVQLGKITLCAWDGNLLYSKGWSGVGFCIEAPVTFWIITNDYGDGTYNGYYIGHGGFEIYDLEGGYAHGVGQSGAVNVNDYGDFLKTYIPATKSEEVSWNLLETAFTGAKILYADYRDAENPSWSDSYGIFFGHVDQCIYYDPEKDDNGNIIGEPSWAIKLTWHDFTSEDRYYGLAVNYNAEGKLESVVEPYDFKGIDRTFYSENWGSEEEAPRAPKLVSPATIHKEIPAFVGHKSTDRFYVK